jgi:uncharacterized protein
MSDSVFVDTSALFALIVDSDSKHALALDYWKELFTGSQPILTTNYVVVESIALVQSRNGLASVQTLIDSFLPMLEIIWLNEGIHKAAIQHVLTANRRNLSLVDCSSFETMRRLRIETVFTFDEHFKEQGFQVVP